ncbi:MAG: peptidyl-alpha-hydroxyglycine alpha-amidating lyase family protein [Thermoguttaceae bacterium]
MLVLRPRRAGSAIPARLTLLIGSMLLGAAAQGAYPNYPPQPTVVEYTVDAGWPQRPAELGPRAAVPSVVVDRQDRIWCFERTDVPVQVYSTDGRLLQSWGRGVFGTPHGLRLDAEENVWTTDIKSQLVQKFTPEGKLLLTLGTPGEAGEDATHFSSPTDVAVTPAGDIFVSDGYGNRRIVHFDPQGRFVKSWGRYGAGPGEFCLPHQIVVDRQGALYVADRNSGRIQLFEQSGRYLGEWSNLIMPWGLWISPNDEIWACGSSPQSWYMDGTYPPPKDQIVMRFSRDGVLRQLWTVPIGADGEEKPGQCNWLHAVAADSKGNLYAGDIMGKRLQKFVRKPALAP